MAAVWNLPVVFVCENNLYMEYTPIGDVTAVEHPAADRAAAYGLEPILSTATTPTPSTPWRLGRARAGRGAGERPVAGRGDDLPARRPLARRPRQVPARRRGRGLAEPRPDPDVPRAAAGGSASTRTTLDGDRRRGRRSRSTRRPSSRRPAPSPASVARDRGLGRRGVAMAELTYREAVARGDRPGDASATRTVVIPRRGRRRRRAACSRRRWGCSSEFGPDRVRDTPISEQAILGAAMGAAMNGLPADRRDHVQRLLRRVLGHRRQRDRQERGT